MTKTKGSNTNDEMKYVRNNLYGYGFRESPYIAPTMSLNDIETELEIQASDIFILKAQVETILGSYLSKAEADGLYGVSLRYNGLTGELSLVNGNGETIGEPVIIKGDGSGSSMHVDSISLVNEDDHGNEGLFLEFVYTISGGEGATETLKVYSDFNSLKGLFVAGDGIAIDGNGKVSVNLSGGTNEFIEVTPDGISTNGLSTKIGDIDDKVSGISKGNGLVTTNEGEAAFGNYNVSVSGETLFSIGNGTDDENRSNALEVKADGSVWMNVEGEMMDVCKLLAKIAHETY